ncbi:putative disease resistance protein RGA3 [Mercurialis annua]|uniref:putative disease resistance protein RGA3 n=1 Tax=Mercurialis annua TaxID=3986 RepID=UPI00215E0973|nr:putative disease resistance protein RGA3 [Mercurialis annua]XP_055960193.1 putative disease resistance protein RGA3 [Mercurialis annua]XP_055960194.1 putative disease resistance protein RGA3 [Mercurialis annua]
MADFLVSKALDLLTSVIVGQIEQNVKLVSGVKNEVKMLTSNLQSIQAVLIDAEKRQLKEETVNLWLRKLKDITYDIDDVLDEWSIEIQKSKIEGDEHEYTSRPKRTKVWSFVLSFCFCFREVGFRRDIAVKIRELNESLDVIAKEKERYSFSLIKGHENIERAMTTSVINIAEVKGRHHDKVAVIDLLLAESDQNPHVISIVGMGGVGKTTFAKLVYNEEMIKAHFDVQIWVCVSDPFDEVRIAKAILESLTKSTSNLVELQNIVQQIQQCILGRKFLLVLDDVWNEDYRKWEELKHSFECGAPGSKILVTTRKEDVAKTMDSVNTIQLGLLSDKECWEIFTNIAFFQRSRNECIVLEEIGRKIVSRCKGLPLAVKTIASLLRFKKSIREWQDVLNSESWKLKEVDECVLAPLWLSYIDLPSPLKQCFSHCVIFPKDYEMSKSELISLWIGQGYIRAANDKNLEMIGDEYFHNLVMRSFFQDIIEIGENEYLSDRIYCKMHDLVHDFAQSVMKNEYGSIEINSNEEPRIDFNPMEIRHVGITVVEHVSFPISLYSFRKLRSLKISSGGSTSFGVALSILFNELSCLRSLSLRNCGIVEIPSNISNLIHLRQLDLSFNVFEELPESICKLYNLQVLDVERCGRLKSLPKGIGKLINLIYLNNLGTYAFMPKVIGRLYGLQSLTKINISHHETIEAPLSLRDIKNLNQLGGFMLIDWTRQHVPDVDVEDAKGAQLNDKKHLVELSLSFNDEVGQEWRKKQDEELLEALAPPTSLEHLAIWNYQGTNKICHGPSWIKSLICLKSLFLYGWRNCEQLPSLGKLPSLEYLFVGEFESLREVGVEFLGMDHHEVSDNAVLFPKLTELHFSDMKEWEEWIYEDIIADERVKKNDSGNGMEIMPCLRSLHLSTCPKLRVLPSFILQNTSLQIKRY